MPLMDNASIISHVLICYVEIITTTTRFVNLCIVVNNTLTGQLPGICPDSSGIYIFAKKPQLKDELSLFIHGS